MDGREELARLRDEEHHDEFARRKTEASMAAEERQLEREMKEFEETEERVEREIEDEWHREHWGHEPERPPRWPNHEQ
jgi:hypothetical protein